MMSYGTTGNTEKKRVITMSKPAAFIVSGLIGALYNLDITCMGSEAHPLRVYLDLRNYWFSKEFI